MSTSSAPFPATSFPAWPFVVAVVVLLAVPLLLAVTREAPRLAASNSKVLASGVAIELAPGAERCQGGEVLPAKGASILLYIALPDGRPGPPLDVRFLDSRRQLVGSTSLRGGYSGTTLRLPFTAPEADIPHGFACFRNRGDSTLLLAGNLTPLNPDTARGPNNIGARRTDEVRIDYFQAEPLPVWRTLPDVAKRFAFFKPRFLGPWSMWFALTAVLVLGAASVLLLRRFADKRAADRRPLRWAAACFGVALAHGALWSIVTPALQPPDEMVHYAYANYVGKHGKPPPVYVQTDRRNFAEPLNDTSSSISRVLPFNVEGKSIWSDVDEDLLRNRVADVPVDPRGARKAAGSPPLYYYASGIATEPLVFLDGLDKLFAMRLVSSMLSAFTAAFTVLFLAEAFRRVDLGVVLGGLAVALQPVVGFVAGGVNNDNLLYPLCALLFYLLARGFRRGMTPRLATAIGLTLGFGYLAKQRMLFLVPLALLAVLCPTWGSWRAGLLRRIVPAGIATTGFLVLAGGWRMAASSLERYGTASPAKREMERSIRGALSYTWQSFFPRLWFMQDDFTRWPQYLFWDVYIEGFVGRFGWFQYDFPDRVEVFGAIVLGGLAVLASRALWKARHRLRGREIELLVYVGLLLSTLVLLAIAGYDYRARTTYNLEQTRYLFPCLALYGGFVALALRGVPLRFRWAAACGMATLFAGHVMSSMLLTVHRYYV